MSKKCSISALYAVLTKNSYSRQPSSCSSIPWRDPHSPNDLNIDNLTALLPQNCARDAIIIWCSPSMMGKATPIRPRGKIRAMVALIRATRPDESFLPPPEIVGADLLQKDIRRNRVSSSNAINH